MKKSILIAFLSLAACVIQGQTAPSWVKFSTPSNFQNHDAEDVSVGVDSLNNVYTAASMYDTLNNLSKGMVVKYNPAGVQQWIKFYDNTANAYNGTYITALLVDKNGNSYSCGYGKHNGSSGDDFLVMKYDNAGNQVWVQYWDGGQNNYDYVTCATFDAAGNIIVAGYANSGGSTGDDIAIVKYSTSGTKLWDYTYNYAPTNGEDRALAVCSDAGNDAFITGSSYGVNARDMITIKVNSAGAFQWVNRAPRGNGSADQHGYGIVADAGGNCYATGSTDNWTTFKYGTNGSTVWTNVYAPNSNGFNLYNTKKVMLDKGANNVYIAGDAGFSGTSTDLVVSKINASTGFSFWSVNKDNGGIDRFTDMAMDTLGYVYVSGYFEGPQGPDMCVMAVSSSGVIIWNNTYNNVNNNNGKIDFSYHMAVDHNRDVILAGVSEDRGESSDDSFDVITLKYSNLAVGLTVRNMETAYLHIYPNPAKDKLTIDLNDRDLIGAVVAITSISGQTVKSEKINALSQEINLSQLNKGMYFINITQGNATATKKFIIE